MRFFPEFRIVSYPLPKAGPKNKKKSDQLEFGLEIPESPKKENLTKTKAYDLLRQTLPPSYGIALAPFKSHQWSMMVYLSKNRRFYELLKSSPALAFILANNHKINFDVYFDDLSLDELTGMKQQKLLELIDLPGTKKMAQILRKIQPSSAHPKLLGQIKYCLQDEESVKKLSHLKKVNAGVLYLLGSTESIRTKATPQLLEEVSNNRPNDHYPSAAQQMRECLRWHNQLRANQRFPRFQTLEALTAYHEELSAETDRLLEIARQQQEQADRQAQTDRERELEEMLRKPFPKPPIEGTRNIIPLRSGRELVEEGRLQHNCVGRYSHFVCSGSCYIYRVLKPERATLSIVKRAGSQWSIGELKASCNSAVKPETKSRIASWLESNQLGI